MTRGGAQCYISDRGSFDAITAAVAMLVTARRLYPQDFGWQYPGRDPVWVDELSGSSWIRTSVDAGKPAADIMAGWQPELAAFARLVHLAGILFDTTFQGLVGFLEFGLGGGDRLADERDDKAPVVSLWTTRVCVPELSGLRV